MSRVPASFVALATTMVLLTACERETRRFHDPRATTPPRSAERLTTLVAGPYTADARVESPYQRNAYGISEGKRLYAWYNCQGCHANGGGGMGPTLMDDQWIYGSDPENIFATIAEGRPNGMPSFRGKLTEQQTWQLVAYVQSLSGMVPKDAAGGRSDNMQVKPQEQSMPDRKPQPAPARHEQ